MSENLIRPKGRISIPQREQDFEKFKQYKNKAIDFEEGTGFYKNITDKNTQFFFCGYSFVIFRIMKVEDVSTCYIYYMYAEDKNSFKSCYYAMINYCLGNKVKFIYYAEKEKRNPFSVNFLKSLGFKTETNKKIYPKDFVCKKCGKDRLSCECNTISCYI